MPRIVWAGLILVLLAAIALVGIPIYLLWPFKPQGPSFVPWAWTLRREGAPMVTPLLAAILVGVGPSWLSTITFGASITMLPPLMALPASS